MTNTEINEIAEKETGFPGLVTNSGLSRKCDPLELLTFILLPLLLSCGWHTSSCTFFESYWIPTHWRSTRILCSWGIINAVFKWDGSLLHMSPLLECELCGPTILLSQASSMTRNMAIVTSKPNVLRLLILRKRCAEGNSTGVFWLAHLHGSAGEVLEKEQAWGPTWQHCGQGRQHQTNQGKHRTGEGWLPRR